METLLNTASLFSGGKFEEVADKLSENVEFHIYEDDKHLIGKDKVLSFCRQVAQYFASIETDFREYGHVEGKDKVVIYGYAEFKRDGKIVNTVNSCDVYEFNSDSNIEKIHSYCNSQNK